jgi:hypothetical protein
MMMMMMSVHQAYNAWSFLWTTLILSLLVLATLVSADEDSRYFQCPPSTDSHNHTAAAALNPVVVKGQHFFDAVTGDPFSIRGIAYYPRPNAGILATGSNSVDFFTTEYRHLWEPDIEHLKQLGVNTIRIYAVDPSQNHDAFMCALQQAGIYVMVGLLADCLGCGIGPDANDDLELCYPPSVKERGQWIMNDFSKFSNLLAFDAGNEVTLYATDREIQRNAVCQKKFIHDMRQYIATCSAVDHSILPRPVPIGMANWDVEREAQALYFACHTARQGGDNSTDSVQLMETPEWYGINAYQHCDGSATSIDDLDGWSTLQQDFDSYQLPLPIVVSEYGCRSRTFPTMGDFEAQRTWLQVDALYSSPAYVQTFAGGIVFEYSAEKVVVDTSAQNQPWPYEGFMKVQYGIGYYSPIDCNHTTIPCQYEPYPEFDVLAQKFTATASQPPVIASMEDYTPAWTEPPTCPEGWPLITSYDWSYIDHHPDLPCYVVATPAPTASPTTAPPTVSPAIAGTTTTSQNNDNDDSEDSVENQNPSGMQTTSSSSDSQQLLWFSFFALIWILLLPAMLGLLLL